MNYFFQGVAFYLLYPIIYLIVISPFFVLYAVSDFFFFLFYYVIGYRKKVVLNNLKLAFPEKSAAERKAICKGFYKYLCDLILETFKTITWDEKQVREHVKMHGVEMLNELYEKNKSVLVVMGHLGNWEWAGPGFSLNCKHQLYVVYLPLTNPFFEKLLIRTRTKFNTKIIPKKETLRQIVANRNTINATALIADQAPAPISSAWWLEFMGMDTPVFNGPEKIAKKMGTPVVYMFVERVGRGQYEIHPRLLTEEPKATGEKEITEAFYKMLEQDIRKRPTTWLWSHRRWKHQRN